MPGQPKKSDDSSTCLYNMTFSTYPNCSIPSDSRVCECKSEWIKMAGCEADRLKLKSENRDQSFRKIIGG